MWGYVLYVIGFGLVGRSHHVVAIRRVCILVYNVLPANVAGQVVHFLTRPQLAQLSQGLSFLSSKCVCVVRLRLATCVSEYLILAVIVIAIVVAPVWSVPVSTWHWRDISFNLIEACLSFSKPFRFSKAVTELLLAEVFEVVFWDFVAVTLRVNSICFSRHSLI